MLEAALPASSLTRIEGLGAQARVRGIGELAPSSPSQLARLQLSLMKSPPNTRRCWLSAQ